MATTKRTRYAVKADSHTSAEINNLEASTGAIVHDTTEGVGKYYDGTSWLDVGANGAPGWASYNDTQYTSGSPLVLAANTDTPLPNNAGSVVNSQLPSDITSFWDGSTITGRNGDNLDVQIYFKAESTVANQWLDVWIDIGGGVGELYRQTFSFPKGSGVERGIMYSLASSYTLNTWEANGGTVYVRSNGIANIYDIVFNFDRSHKAR